jgi:chemotaxis protein CheX
MDVRYINPFIDAVRAVFATMIHIDVTLGKPHVTEISPKHDVSGIIGMSGDVVGSIVVSFPASVAKVIVGKFAGCERPVGSPDFADALGEVVNMISGAAKAKFEGKRVSISTPSVVIGTNHTVACPANTVCISLPCAIYCGEFSIDIAVREDAASAKAAA